MAKPVHAGIAAVASRGGFACGESSLRSEVEDVLAQRTDQTVSEAGGAAGVVGSGQQVLQSGERDVLLDTVLAPDPVHQHVALLVERSADGVNVRIDLGHVAGRVSSGLQEREDLPLIADP